METLSNAYRPDLRTTPLLTALSVAALMALTGCVSTAPKMGEDKGTVSGAAGGPCGSIPRYALDHRAIAP